MKENNIKDTSKEELLKEYREMGLRYLMEKYNENGYKVKTFLYKYEAEPRQCECGCGEFTRKYNSYINGHNSIGKPGFPHTKESKQKISQKAKKRFENGQKVNCKIYDIPSKEDLMFLYEDLGHSMNTVSKMMGTSIPTLKKWLKSYDIGIRNISQSLLNEYKTGRVTSSFSDPLIQQKAKKTNSKGKSSKEIEIIQYIKSICDYEVKQTYFVGDFEIDIYIPERNIAFEYNGLYWHTEKFKNKNLHQYKTLECEKNGIYLIHIWEDDWLDKTNIIKSKIKYLLRGPEKRHYARKCIVKSVNNKEYKNFYDTYHIQGGRVNYGINYGLYFEEELVACMSFSRRKENIYELTRFCSKESVIGGFSRLVKHFLKNNNCEELYSFADLTIVYRNDNVYVNNGWIEEEYLKPDYKYIVNGKRLHKFGFRHSSLKHKLKYYDPELTEYENCLNNGIFRIWDSGKIKYKYPL